MPKKIRYLLPRDGRYFARIVIPKNLRPYLEPEDKGKWEFREPLGADYRTAVARLATEVAGFQAKLAVAERRAMVAKGEAITPGRYPLPVEQIALRNYNQRIAFDTELRNMDNRHAMGLVDDRLVELLREGIAGGLSDDSLETLVGRQIERFRRLGNTTVVKGSPEWRTLARALCVSELEALARVAERDEGDFTGKPENPILAEAVEADEIAAEVDASEFNGLTFEMVIAEKERLTGMGLGGKVKSATRSFSVPCGRLPPSSKQPLLGSLQSIGLAQMAPLRVAQPAIRSTASVMSEWRRVMLASAPSQNLRSNMASPTQACCGRASGLPAWMPPAFSEPDAEKAPKSSWPTSRSTLNRT